MNAEYIPPASAGVIATRREIEPVEPPAPRLDGRLRRVIVETMDGRTLELHGCTAVSWQIDVQPTYYGMSEGRFVRDRRDGRLELLFEDMVFSEPR